MWDATTGALLLSFEGHQDDVSSIALADGLLFTGTWRGDKSIRIWDTNNGKLLNVLVGHEHVSFFIEDFNHTRLYLA
jgi:WD40 repeat protein